MAERLTTERLEFFTLGLADRERARVEGHVGGLGTLASSVPEENAMSRELLDLRARVAELERERDANRVLDVLARGATALVSNLAKAIGSEATDPEFLLAHAEALKARVAELERWRDQLRESVYREPNDGADDWPLGKRYGEVCEARRIAEARAADLEREVLVLRARDAARPTPPSSPPFHVYEVKMPTGTHIVVFPAAYETLRARIAELERERDEARARVPELERKRDEARKQQRTLRQRIEAILVDEGCDCSCWDDEGGDCQHGEPHRCPVEERCTVCRVEAALGKEADRA